VHGLRLTPAAHRHQNVEHVRRSSREVELPPGPAEGQVSAPRSFRPGERVRHRPRQQGRIVIRALVQGRLLGLKILTLDACVVVGGDDGPDAVVPVPLSSAGLDVSYRSAAPRANSPAPGSGTSLAYAMQLLEQAVHTLEQSRRLRLGDVGLSWPEDLGPRQELCGYLLLVSSWDAVGASGAVSLMDHPWVESRGGCRCTRAAARSALVVSDAASVRLRAPGNDHIVRPGVSATC
jgi:hypothetical protein